MPPLLLPLAFGKISEDFLEIALRVFVGFWAVAIVLGLGFFVYVLLAIKVNERRRRR